MVDEAPFIEAQDVIDDVDTKLGLTAEELLDPHARARPMLSPFPALRT